MLAMPKLLGSVRSSSHTRLSGSLLLTVHSEITVYNNNNYYFMIEDDKLWSRAGLT